MKVFFFPPETSDDVTVDKSDHHCKVVCVRKENTDTCRVTATLNVKNNSSRIFYRNLTILSVVTLSVLCIIFSGGCCLFHRRRVHNPAVEDTNSNQNDEMYYASTVSRSERTKRGQTYTTTVNPLEEYVENADIELNPYSEIRDNSYLQGGSVYKRQVEYVVKSHLTDSSRPLEQHTTKSSSDATYEGTKQNEILELNPYLELIDDSLKEDLYTKNESDMLLNPI